MRLRRVGKANLPIDLGGVSNQGEIDATINSLKSPELNENALQEDILKRCGWAVVDWQDDRQRSAEGFSLDSGGLEYF